MYKLSTCTFNLILAQRQIFRIIKIISKLALTSLLLVILEESKLPFWRRHCVILNSIYFYLNIFSVLGFTKT